MRSYYFIIDWDKVNEGEPVQIEEKQADELPIL